MTEYEALGRCYKLRDVSKNYNKTVMVPCVVLNKIYTICGQGARFHSRRDVPEVPVHGDVLDVLIARAQQQIRPAIQLSLPGIQ